MPVLEGGLFFSCDLCGKPYPFIPAADAVAEAEAREVFGEIAPEERGIICTGCWEKVKPSRNPETYQRWLKEEGR